MMFPRKQIALLALSALAMGCPKKDDDTTDDTDTDTDVDTDDTDTDGGSDLPDACDVDGVSCDEGSMVGTLTGEITESLTLTSEWSWVLSGGVFIGDDDESDADVILTVEPGTTIFGDSATDGFLVIQRDAQIDAAGTASEPIVFTSSANDGSRGASDWGGLIINGSAPTNVCGDLANCNVPGEAGSGFYGGDDAADSSGTLTYVRVEFAGTLVNDQQELNCVAFQGVGSGTTVDNLHAHIGADDGVEFFGGTVEVTHLASTGFGDDAIDWTDGFTGKIQWALIQGHAAQGDNGFENDNNGDSNDATPRTKPMVQNATVIGGQDMSGPTNDLGMLVREGAAGLYNKLAVVGWADGCVSLDQYATYANAWTGGDFNGELAITKSRFHCPDASEAYVDGDDQNTGGTADFDAADLIADDTNNASGDPMLEDPYNETAPDFLPAAGSPLLMQSGDDLTDSFFTATDYIGAFGDTDWLSWTEFAAN